MRRCQGEYFHVVTRGNGRQIIFEDGRDYLKFLELLKEELLDTSVEIHAFCLMDNHVHLLFRGDIEDISKIMHGCCLRYAKYFNIKSGRVGHLFQGRFKSEPIENEAHYFTVVRYILQNPQKAGIARADRYLWSSYKSYFNRHSMVNVDLLHDRFDSAQSYKDFVLGEAVSEKDLGFSELAMETDSKDEKDSVARDILKEMAGTDSLNEVKGMSKIERDKILLKFKEAGISVRRIERLTGVGRNIIQRAK